jgi:hypothetical protein
MAKRNPTNPDAGAPAPSWELSEQQRTAVDLIVSGRNLQDTADALGVQRLTVSQWVNHHPGFQAALNLRRRELWADLVDHLRALAPRAVQILANALESDQPMPAALAILRACGLANGPLAPTGPTTPEEAAAVLHVQDYERQHAQEDTQVGLGRRDTDRLFAQMAANPLAGLLAEGGRQP